MVNVKMAKPQTSRNRARLALNSGEFAPVGSSAVMYGEMSWRVGSCKRPNESQKMPKRPMVIIEKKLPIIHSPIIPTMSSMAPKKKIPLPEDIKSDLQVCGKDKCQGRENLFAEMAVGFSTHAIGDAPDAPPQPMRIMAKEKPAMLKLEQSVVCSSWLEQL